MSTTLKRYFWIVFIILLAACAPGVTTVTPTEVDNAISAQTAATMAAQLTQAAAPTETPVSTLTRTPLPLVTVDGLRVAYIKSLSQSQYVFMGNLYVQESGGQPVQLTDSGLDRSPLFSDDGQKIVFFRGRRRDNDQVYSVNADGSEEQSLVTGSLLTALNIGYDKSTELHNLAFVPGTHQLLFSTREFYPTLGDSNLDHHLANPNYDLLLVDTDSAKIRRLLAPGQASYFQVSPNGKLIWVLSGNYLDVIGLDGKTRHRLTDYPPVLPPSPTISMPDLYWTQDSSKLSLALPARKTNFGYAGPDLRIFWQYSLDGSPGVEIRLNPPPVGESFRISSDGNWIAYSYYIGDAAEGKWNPAITSGVYLGSLRTGASQLLDVPGLRELSSLSYYWSPDNAHFIVEDFWGRTFMGNLHGEITPLSGGYFLGWMDESRYLYGGAAAVGEIGKEADSRVAELPASIGYLTFVFVKH